MNGYKFNRNPNVKLRVRKEKHKQITYYKALLIKDIILQLIFRSYKSYPPRDPTQDVKNDPNAFHIIKNYTYINYMNNLPEDLQKEILSYVLFVVRIVIIFLIKKVIITLQ